MDIGSQFLLPLVIYGPDRQFLLPLVIYEPDRQFIPANHPRFRYFFIIIDVIVLCALVVRFNDAINSS